MKKLDWYIIKKFLGTFFFAISLILVIVIVFDISVAPTLEIDGAITNATTYD